VGHPAEGHPGPDGLPVDPARPPSFLTNPKRWNDGSTRPGDPVHSDPDDVAFLDAVIAHAIAHGQADAHRIYLTGFSNGAAMAFRYAAERPGTLAAVALLAGYCHVVSNPISPWDTVRQRSPSTRHSSAIFRRVARSERRSRSLLTPPSCDQPGIRLSSLVLPAL